MNARTGPVVLALGLAAAAVAGCGRSGGGDDAAGGRLRVFVTVQPQAYLLERIGGPHVAVEVLAGAGQDPHTFEPTPRQVLALSKARLFFHVGMPLETRLVEKISGSRGGLTVVDMARGIQMRTATEPCIHQGEADDHEQCDHEEHNHAAEPDPHVWLSPPLAKILAANAAEALAQADPEHAADFEKNLAALCEELDALHEKLAESLEPHRGQSFYVFHPALGYFGETYGLTQRAVEFEGKRPSPRQLRALIKRAKAERVRIVFVQPQFDRRTAEVVAELIGGATVPIDPLAKDVLKNLDAAAREIRRSLSS